MTKAESGAASRPMKATVKSSVKTAGRSGKKTAGTKSHHDGEPPGLPYRQSIAGCLDTTIASDGLTGGQLAAWLKRVEPHVAALNRAYETGSIPLLRIPEEVEDIEAAETALARLSEGADTIVFFGTGGSALGGQTLAQIAGWNIPGDGGPERRRGPRTRFYNNLDARTLERALSSLDLPRTRFVVISKSGGTPETLAQAVVTISAVREAGLGRDIPRLFLGLTGPDKDGSGAASSPNPLRRLCAQCAIPMLEHHAGIGGRFSGLTNVGLLPALTRGLDVRAIRDGAKSVIEAMRSDEPTQFAPAVGAAVTVGLMRDHHVRTLVMLPYCDRLASFAEWYVQLWAESLGKGGEGSSPIAALGPLDQHSQMQLWMDGPKEHMLTILRVAAAGTGPVLDPELARLAGLDMLAGRTIGDLVDAQGHAIPEALAKARRPVRTIDLDKLDERAIGALMMHFMIETILAAGLLGVDPFDQPAVELGKRLAKERLTRKT